MNNNQWKTIKILLLGDCGVGKSLLAERLTNSFVSSSIYHPTFGCAVHVLPVSHVQGNYFVEMWEVGGSPRFSSSRSIFYEDCDGVIFVWDVSVEATYHSLGKWLDELVHIDRGVSTPDVVSQSSSKSDNSPNLPLLIVGSKMDKLGAVYRREIQLACSQQVLVSSKSPNLDCKPFINFFNNIFEMRFRSSSASPSSATTTTTPIGARNMTFMSPGGTGCLTLRHRTDDKDKERE
eukprot:gene11607-24303_t